VKVTEEEKGKALNEMGKEWTLVEMMELDKGETGVK